MNSVSVKVYGKINLSLGVRGSENGYHILDTVMASISVFDVVSVCPRNDDEITVTFDGNRDGSGSNAMKAALLTQAAFCTGGADIKITTGIPSGAGLGGSSADAAGVIRAMIKAFGAAADEEISEKIAASVGSDVPYMLTGGYARLTGTATGLTRFGAPCGGKILLTGKGKVDTGECFRAFDNGIKGKERPDNDRLIAALARGDVTAANGELINELMPAATSLNPTIAEAIAVMRAHGLKASMTGSGAYSFGLGRGEDMKAAETELKARGFNAFIAELVPSGIEFI